MLGRATIAGLLLALALAACEPDEKHAPLYGGAGGTAGDGGAGFGGGTLQLGGAGGASGFGGGGGGSECAREVRLTTAAVGEPEPFDLIIVADHSQSLSWSRESLASGLSTLLADAREHTARIFVLTPTQYGESSRAAINRVNGDDMVAFRDPATNEAYSHAMTEYAQTCTDTAGMPIECPAYDPIATSEYSADGTWTFVMPEPIAAITPSMSDAELAEQQTAVTDAILALGGTGSPHEQPLCTLNRYLLQNPTPLPSHAVFVVISDEDDAADTNACMAEYHYERAIMFQEFGEVCMTDDCDSYQYYLQELATSQALTFDCVPVDDLGNPQPAGSFHQNAWRYGEMAAECTGPSDAVPCSDGAIDWAETICGIGHIAQSCTASCGETEITGCTLLNNTDSVDYCSQAFEYSGTTYANLEAYCDATVGEHDWLRCERYGYTSGEQLTQTLYTVALVNDLIESFNTEATTRFGVGGYYAAVIGMHPGDTACTPQAGQSEAVNLARIATSPDALFSICGDYSGALAGVRAFTEQLVDSTLAIELAPDERISVVYAEHANGTRRALDPGLYTLDRAQGLLTLAPNALLPMENGVAVEVEKTCVLQPY